MEEALAVASTVALVARLPVAGTLPVVLVERLVALGTRTVAAVPPTTGPETLQLVVLVAAAATPGTTTVVRVLLATAVAAGTTLVAMTTLPAGKSQLHPGFNPGSHDNDVHDNEVQAQFHDGYFYN